MNKSKSIKKQAEAAKRHAELKAFRQYKRQAKKARAYIPGNIGPSVIATAIKNAYGHILSRQERKQLAKRTGQPVKKFYARG